MFNNVISFVKEKWQEFKASAKQVVTTAAVLGTGLGVAIAGGVAEAQTTTAVTVDDMGINIPSTATAFGTNLGTIILAVLGITMGIAVIRFFAGWLGAKKAR